MLQRQGKMSASAGQAWGSSVEMTGRATAVRSRNQGLHMFYVILLPLSATRNASLQNLLLLSVVGCCAVTYFMTFSNAEAISCDAYRRWGASGVAGG
jgi:hypothetical protein